MRLFLSDSFLTNSQNCQEIFNRVSENSKRNSERTPNQVPFIWNRLLNFVIHPFAQLVLLESIVPY